MKIQKLLIVAILLIYSSYAYTQGDSNYSSHTITIEVPVALLDLKSKSGKSVTLNATAPTEAGLQLEINQTNSDLWINYSSIVGPKQSRDVTVQITEGKVPKGIELSVVAANDAGKGDGAMGEPAHKTIVLNDKESASIIEDVGSAYTGNGARSGHNLTYAIKQSDEENAYESLSTDESETIAITYTLTDN